MRRTAAECWLPAAAAVAVLFICSSFSPENERHFHSVPLFLVSLSFWFLSFLLRSFIQLLCALLWLRIHIAIANSSLAHIRPMPKTQLHNWNRRLFFNQIPAGVCGSFKAWVVPKQRKVNVTWRKCILHLFFHIILHSLPSSAFSAWLGKFKWIEQISGLRDFVVRRSVGVQNGIRAWIGRT